MTYKEFQIWLEGFNEAIDGAPTQKQWETIKSKLASITPDIITKTEIIKEKEIINIPSIPVYPKPWAKPSLPWEQPALPWRRDDIIF
jgi:hypothetical protein